MDQKDTRKVIHINFFPAVVDQIYFPQLEVIGDIANSIRQISDEITNQECWNTDYFYKLKKYLNTQIQESVERKFPYHPGDIVQIVRKLISDDDIVTLDNGMYKIWFARNYPTYLPNTLLLDNALATMGAGLPSAIAAKMVYPNKKIVAICGDGGFMMNSSELETAKRLNLDLTIIILKDNAYGMIKWKQESMNLDSFALDFSNPNFVAFAQSFGIAGYKIVKLGDFETVLKHVLSEKGVHVLEVPIDYSDSKRILVDELKIKTCIL